MHSVGARLDISTSDVAREGPLANVWDGTRLGSISFLGGSRVDSRFASQTTESIVVIDRFSIARGLSSW